MNIALSPFKEFIRGACGLLFEGVAEEKLLTALKNRMLETGDLDQNTYIELLSSDRAEFQHLVNLLTINETYFFREPEQLRLLSDRLVPRFLMKKDGQTPIRILSAGCSSGEEPYSLVMSLKERYGETLSRLCSFTAVDIDSDVLAKARLGKYGGFSFRGVPEEVRDRYFVKNGGLWQLKKEIRELVDFRELNLLDLEVAAGITGFDMVFFRNVSIYFDEHVRIKILKSLHALMKSDSILLTGVSETIANDLGIFDMVEENGLFYFVKGTDCLPERAVPSHQTTRWPAALTEERASEQRPLPILECPDSWKKYDSHSVDFDEICNIVLDRQYAQALPLVEEELKKNPDDVRFMLLKSWMLLENKQLGESVRIANSVLRLEAWSIDAFFLLGLASKWEEKNEEAISHFKQAVYACHTCWPARYHLAELYRRAGMDELARREYRAALGQICTSHSETGMKTVSPGVSVSEVRQICELRLASMEKTATGQMANGD